MHYSNPDGPIWIGAGEASGDMYGALLARELRNLNPGLKIMGMGGPAMEAQSVDVRHSMKLISLVGGTEILAGLPRIIRLLGEIKRSLMQERPRAIILLDCPDFHFRVVKIARKLGIPVYYYISPQLWAWRSGRARFLRDNVRKLICILPFEKAFYRKYDMDVEYAGHPLMDQIPLDELDTISREADRIAILPGSRNREVSSLLPEFAATARNLLRNNPNLRFSLVRAPGMEPERLAEFWPDDIPVDLVEPDDRYHAIRQARFVLAASGTVSLECALIGTPAIIAYQLSKLSVFIGRMIINVPFISLPNLIMNREIFPENIQEDARAENLTRLAESWLDDTEYSRVRSELAALRKEVGEPGAVARAAEIIFNDIPRA
ncbi:lipid-A-disaccharide synthase [Pseudodesulfovibrio tunisiensis]|uniref:lipid-A-disaccharide synthase n=1 Tax=Pseudodesulfovibrio tunisiensis TaxID=463192 RepID=UPI001FB2A003|nr:lipid-A-disaccharide synthase [Pseudodesulfovibrio tunisiensis]